MLNQEILLFIQKIDKYISSIEKTEKFKLNPQIIILVK